MPSIIKFTNETENNGNGKEIDNGNLVKSADQLFILKQLNTKRNIIKRYSKELDSYENELLHQLKHIEKLEGDVNNCPFNIRKQYEVLEETRNIIPDCKQRLENAKDDLQMFMKRHPELTEHCEALS